MRIVALIGEPATGKSVIVSRVLANIATYNPGFSYFKYKTLNGLRYVISSPDAPIYVLGSYEPGERFPGTDRLSMAVQPAALEWLRLISWKEPNARILFEGDRLGTKSFLSECSKLFELKLFVTECSEEEKARNHAARSDSQREAFLKSRKTKIENLKAAFPGYVSLRNAEPKDLEFCAGLILRNLL